MDYHRYNILVTDDFKKIALALQALQKKCCSIPVLAIYWIQMQHPVFPVQKEILKKWDMLVNGTPSKNFFSEGMEVFGIIYDSVLNVARCLKYICIRMPQVVWLRWKKRHEIREISQMSFDVVIKSWSFGTQRLEGDSDFYFGDLQYRLKRQNVNALLLCGDPTYSDVRAFVNTHIEVDGLQRFPELLLIPFWAFFFMFFWQIGTSLKLCYLSLRDASGVMRYVFRLSARDVLTVETLTKGLYYWIGQKTVQIWHPKSFITLYEGRSWETCVLKGIKKEDFYCKVVGYQHAVLFSSSLSLLQPDSAVLRAHVPDIILCLGPQTRDMMQNGHLSERIVFGSFRRPENTREPSFCSHPEPKKKTVLVMPEGYPEETIALFNFAMDLANGLPDHKFILRCHPALSFSVIKEKLKDDLRDYSNVELSDAEFNEDIKRSSAIFYRGTSSVMYTILQGIKPYYINFSNSNNVDPLFELEKWREQIDTVDDAIQKLQYYKHCESNELIDDWRVAVHYVNDYIVSVGDDLVSNLVFHIQNENALKNCLKDIPKG